MTVRELMAVLATMDQDAVVCFDDTYTQEEGWWDGHSEAVMGVTGVEMDSDGRAHLCGDEMGDGEDEEEEDEEEDEEEWDD